MLFNDFGLLPLVKTNRVINANNSDNLEDLGANTETSVHEIYPDLF